MSTVIDDLKTSRQTKTGDNSTAWSAKSWLLIALGCVLFGHMPLLTEHVCNLWIRPHYQFLVFLPVATGLLWWRGLTSLRQKWPDSQAGIFRSDRPFIWAPWLFTCLLLLAFATWLRSPWLTMISFMLATLAALLLMFGRQGFSAMLPGWLMLIAGISLPGNLDVRLISQLRTITTNWSSAVLDYFGVLHRLSGNVIEIPGISLFIADACTGIHSLFVLLAAAFFLGLWQQRTVIHIVVLMVSTLGLVFIENVARVSLVTALCQYNPQFSEGWRHAMLGFILFGSSLLLIFSMDALVCILIPVPDWRKVWRFLFVKGNGPEIRRTPPKFWPLGNYLSRGLVPAYVAFAILGLIQLTWVPSRAQQMVQMMKKNPIEMKELGAEALPKEIRGWKQTNFETVTRILDDPMGEHSQKWTYERDGKIIIVSMDYPYLRIHDLTLCYEGVGWQVRSKSIQKGNAILPFATAILTQSLQEQAFLAHSLHTPDGLCEVAVDEELSLAQLYQKRFEYDRPWFQIQLLAMSPEQIDASLQEEFSGLFLDLRKQLLDQCQTLTTQ